MKRAIKLADGMAAAYGGGLLWLAAGEYAITAVNHVSYPNRVLRENAERAALNAPIQGSAADIMKLGLLHIHDQLITDGLRSRVLLQIHDELVVEVAPGEWDAVESIVRQRMGDAAELSVPLDVQIGRGENWDVAGH